MSIPTPGGRHVVICGYSRSGSTLLYAMLRACLPGFSYPDGEAAAEAFVAAPGDHVTKRPFDVFAIGRVLAANAAGKRIDVLVNIRDPRAVLTSRHSEVPDDHFCDADLQWGFSTGRGAFRRASPGLLPTHNAVCALLADPPPGVSVAMPVRYEELVADPLRVQRRLARRLGLSFSGRFDEFHGRGVPAPMLGALNGLRPPDASRLEAWLAPEHRARLLDQFGRFPALLDVVRAYGYEADDAWLADLAGG